MIELFGPGWGNYAIRGIVEVEAPEAVSMVPSTPGWWALGVGTLMFVCGHAYGRYRRWQRDRYRREAMAAVASLRERLEAGDSAALRELAPLLRATALQVLPREEVVNAYGRHWAQTLNRLAPEVPALPVDLLHEFAYAPTASLPDPAALDALQLLERWIAEHRRPEAA